MSTSNWYALQTSSGYESVVQKSVLQLIETKAFPIEECKVITETVMRPGTRRGKDIIRQVEEKVYPSYVFIKMEHDINAFYAIKSFRGAAKWVGVGYLPSPLTEAEVQNIPELLPDVELWVHVGDICMVVDGPLKDHTVTVTGVDQKAMKIEATVFMFGKEIPVELDVDCIERYEE